VCNGVLDRKFKSGFIEHESLLRKETMPRVAAKSKSPIATGSLAG
jgi:hypothetical protein